MKSFFSTPERTPVDIIIVILIILIFLLILYILNISSKRPKKKAKDILINAYLNRYGLTYDQKNFILSLFSFKKFLDISHLFRDEIYFDHVVKEYITSLEKKGIYKNKIDQMQNIHSSIKEKIKFTKIKPTVSNDLKCGENVKLQINGVGFITGKILYNYIEGIVVKTHYFHEILKKINKNTSVTMYCWDDKYQYEIYTNIIRIINKKNEHYFLLAHNTLKIKDKYIHGMKVKTRIPVYFTHMFDPEIKKVIKEKVFRGTINAFSVFGVEVFTRYIIEKGGVFLFEFRKPEEHSSILNFTGKIDDFDDIKKRGGRVLFIKFIDMNEECKNYIFKFITNKMNELLIKK